MVVKMKMLTVRKLVVIGQVNANKSVLHYIYQSVLYLNVPSIRQSVPKILTGTISAKPKMRRPISQTSNGSLSPLRKINLKKKSEK